MSKELTKVGTNEYLSNKISLLRLNLQPYFKKYDTDNMWELTLKADKDDYANVNAKVSELSAYISLINFVNSTPTEFDKDDTDQEKLKIALRNEVHDLDDMVCDNRINMLFSWSDAEKLPKENLKNWIKDHIDKGTYEVAILGCVFLLHQEKKENKNK